MSLVLVTGSVALGLMKPGDDTAGKLFRPAGHGCAMAHCQPSMNDQVQMKLPRQITSDWIDTGAASSDQGLGCAGNGATAVCTFGNRLGDRDKPYLKAYDARGRVQWDSGDSLNSWSWTSVPMVSENGGAIMADDSDLVRFNSKGKVMWSTPTPGGRPISPTQTENGAIVVATKLGPVSAYDPTSGKLLGTLPLDATLDGLDGYFDTTNTPGGRGNRVYVSTEFELDGSNTADPNHHARLYAIDVRPSKPPGKRLKVAWYYEFGARSGASPTVVGKTIIFDGDRETPSSPSAPRFFGVKDMGDHPKLLWQRPLENPGVASSAADPRGGVWVFSFAKRSLWRISDRNGSILQNIDLDALVDAPDVHVPLSAMSITEGPGGHPVMLVSARSVSSVFLVAIDLERETLLWKFQIPGTPSSNTPEGQFPVIARRNGDAAVVFTALSGVRGVVGPAGPTASPSP